MIEIKTKVSHITYVGTYDDILINGTYSIDSNNILTNISGSLNKDNAYVGGFDVYQNEDGLIINKHGIKLENIELADPIITQCIEEIKTLI